MLKVTLFLAVSCLIGGGLVVGVARMRAGVLVENCSKLIVDFSTLFSIHGVATNNPDRWSSFAKLRIYPLFGRLLRLWFRRKPSHFDRTRDSRARASTLSRTWLSYSSSKVLVPVAVELHA